MIKVGITGGIGSGKTTVCRIFEVLGVPVYYADDRAKWLMEHQPEVVNALVAEFGPTIYDENGRLNRAQLAELVFPHPERLKVLNGIVHPAVFEDGFRWEMEQAAAGVPYTLKEAALLIESGSHQFLDKLIVVTAPEALRIERVQQRDGWSETEIKQRISRQMSEEEKLKLADYVVQNDGQLLLTGQVLYIHRILLQSAKGQ